MRIAMIGTGYVGLVSGACFADFGHHVTCVDKDAAKIDGLNAGRDADLGAGARSAGQGQCRARPARPSPPTWPTGVEGAEAVFIAVGTPARRGDGHADLTYVFDAVRELAKVDQAGNGRGDQVDRPGRDRRQDRGDPARGGRRGRIGRVQPRIPARRRGDRRLQASRPDRRRRRGRARAARCCAKSTGRCSSTGRRS